MPNPPVVRIVLDTNVVVSALIWGGTPFKLIEAAVRGDVDLCTSPALLAELLGVLARDHLLSRLNRRNLSAEEAVNAYAGLALIVTPAAVERVVRRDPADDQVIATALAAGATFIVSGDRDLIALQSHANIRIVTPAEAAAILGL